MRRRREQGIALIAVLWMLVLLSIVAAALSLETRSSTRVARNMAENAAARAAADAGVQRALLDLESVATGDKAKFRADGTVYDWQFANAKVRISVRDEAGKIDLNQAPEPLMVALFTSVGVDPAKAQALADAIADFRDPDNLRRLSGAELSDYRDAGLNWGPKNAPFQAVDELQQVFGMTPELYSRVAPDLTVYSVATTLPMAADQRMSGLLRKAGITTQSPPSSPGLAFSIRAEAKSPNGGVFVREAIVQPNPDQPIPWILSWRQGAPKT
jgi:general secretion pathway protein K